jgi:hypothetical protein
MRDRAAMRGERSNLQRAAWIFGLVFTIVGIGGFIPGITTHYGDLTNFSSPGAKELGFVGTNILENIIHLLYGAAGFALSRTWDGARTYFIGGGLVYVVVWIYGLVIDLDSGANFLGVNAAANWVHFVLGLVMFGIGLVMGRRYAPRRSVT